MAKEMKLVQPIVANRPAPAVLVGLLEQNGGNLDRCVQHLAHDREQQEQILFDLYLELNKPENIELKKRWTFALKLSATVRMDLLRCKAFTNAENFENKSSTSSAPDISFFKTLLNAPLVEESERIKSKYRPALLPGQTAPRPEDDEITDLEDKFTDAEGA